MGLTNVRKTTLSNEEFTIPRVKASACVAKKEDRLLTNIEEEPLLVE